MGEGVRKVCEGDDWKKKRVSCFYNVVYLDIKGYLNIDEDIYLGEGLVKGNWD